MSKKSTKVNRRKSILVRAYIVFGLALLFAVSVLVAAARLQMDRDDEFSRILREKNTRIVNVQAIRGNIYAADGSLLATSVPRYDMVFDAYTDGLTPELFRKNIDSLSLLFANYFPEKDVAGWKTHLSALRKNKVRYAILKKDLGFDMVKRMKTWPLISLGKFKSGIWYEEHGKRLYFMGDLARRTIGYTKDKVSVGLEGAFDSMLRGVDGKRMEQRMPGNIWRPVQVGNFKDPLNGQDIMTTLDVNLQDVAQNALQKVLEANEADHGCAVVMEVKTGAIRAMANLKRLKDGKYLEAQNYAIEEFSEPGSTFKLLSTLALLEDGLAKPEDSVDVQWGETTFSGEKMKDASKPNKRILTLQESFEKSSNVGISKLVMKHYAKQPEKFINHALRLGLNIRPEFDIKTSSSPRIKTRKSPDWSSVSLAWMSIGYETKISPLQMLMLYNAVANGGKMMKPYMVSEVRHEGRLIKKIEPVVLNEKICSPETLAALRNMMEGVVDHGTATNLKNPSYKVAGKTGTAKIAKGKTYAEGSYKASFAGYFPAENPQYTVIVVINEPRKGQYYGALVAGPVFKEIADKIYSSSLKIQPAAPKSSEPKVPGVLAGSSAQLKTVLNQLNISSVTDSSSAWVKGKNKPYSLELEAINISATKIPDVRGMGLRDAIKLLESRRLKVTYSGYGKIVSQSITAGSAPVEGQTIHLILEP
jgi:cell division protein FtsI (penicillin-binding protein 3)